MINCLNPTCGTQYGCQWPNCPIMHPRPVPPIDPSRVAEARAAEARHRAITANCATLAEQCRALVAAGEMTQSTMDGIIGGEPT